MLKYFAFMLIFTNDGLVDVKFKQEPFANLATCQEELAETSARISTQPLPEFVTKLKFVCLPVQDEVQVSD
jgi:hypothetical protein